MKQFFYSKKILALCLAITLILPTLFAIQIPVVAQTMVDQTTSIISGQEYVIATASSITDDQSEKISCCAVLGEEVGSPNGLKYAAMPDANPSDEFLWKITDEGNGKYALYSVSLKKYMKLDNKKIVMTEEKSTVNAVFANGKVHFANDDGQYLRFTKSSGSRFHCSSTSALKFKIYASSELFEEYEEYQESEDTVLSIACLSDMHHEYGIQYLDSPYRESTVNAVNYIKNTIGKVDLMLIGGDITGRRVNTAGGTQVWTGGSEAIDNFQNKNYKLFQTATSTGAVMVITGNHDPEGSVHMDGGYPASNSNDWSSYMRQSVGEFEASVTYSDLGLSIEGIPSQYQNEILGYRYTVRGIPFIGILTPFGDRRDVGRTGHNGLYVKQVEWLEEQLTAIGKDKTVVVSCHYPVTSMPTVVDGGALADIVSTNSEAQAKMKSVLSEFPNVIYTYGHVHDGDNCISKCATSEMVFPSGASIRQSDNSYQTTGWISAFMGSLGYYDNSSQDGALSNVDPKIVRFLVIDFYDDHITFRYHNTGDEPAPGGNNDLVSFTVKRDLSNQLIKNAEKPDDSEVQDSDIPQDTEPPVDVNNEADGKSTDSVNEVQDFNASTEPIIEQTTSIESESKEDPSGDEQMKNGCGSSLAASSVVIISIFGALTTIKKRED